MEKAIEKFLCVLHDEAIHKAVVTEKPAWKTARWLHFSQSWPQQSSKHPSQQTSGKSSRCGLSSSAPSSSSKTSSSSSRCGRGKKFWRFLASLTFAGGRCTCTALECLAVLRRWEVECGGALSWLLGSIPLPANCVLGTPGVSGVGAGSCSQGGDLQDASEGSSGMCRPPQSRLFQPSLSDAEGDRWLETCHRPAYSERLCHPDQVPDGDSGVSIGSIRKGNWMVSIDLKDEYFQIPIHPESRPYLRFVVEGQVFQFRAIFFGLSTAPQMFTRVFSLMSEWLISEGFASFGIWMTGWLWRSLCPFFSITSISCSSCAGNWGLS